MTSQVPPTLKGREYKVSPLGIRNLEDHLRIWPITDMKGGYKSKGENVGFR